MLLSQTDWHIRLSGGILQDIESKEKCHPGISLSMANPHGAVRLAGPVKLGSALQQ